MRKKSVAADGALVTRTGWHTAASATGAALCWVLGLAMVTSNIQAFFHPTWLASLWYMPWLLTGTLLMTWTVFRSLDKATTRREPLQPSPTCGETGTYREDAA